jgi:hypothetical protein
MAGAASVHSMSANSTHGRWMRWPRLSTIRNMKSLPGQAGPRSRAMTAEALGAAMRLARRQCGQRPLRGRVRGGGRRRRPIVPLDQGGPTVRRIAHDGSVTTVGGLAWQAGHRDGTGQGLLTDRCGRHRACPCFRNRSSNMADRARGWKRPAAGPLASAAAALAAVLVGCVPPAQAASPDSADCKRALQALQAQESRVLATRQAGAASSASSGSTEASAAPSLDELKPFRTAAARACLGGNGHPPPPTARLLPPMEMPRPAPSAAWRPPPTPTRPASPAVPVAPMPPPPPTDRPVVITHCDPSGCWANDGVWRPRVGATLGGPRGLCTTQGALVSCP